MPENGLKQSLHDVAGSFLFRLLRYAVVERVVNAPRAFGAASVL